MAPQSQKAVWGEMLAFATSIVGKTYSPRVFQGREIEWSDLYVGITNHPPTRLGEHAVRLLSASSDRYYLFSDGEDEQGNVVADIYRVWQTNSANVARSLEKTAAAVGMDAGGNPGGGGNDDSVYVYIYLITPYTIEQTG